MRTLENTHLARVAGMARAAMLFTAAVTLLVASTAGYAQDSRYAVGGLYDPPVPPQAPPGGPWAAAPNPASYGPPGSQAPNPQPGYVPGAVQQTSATSGPLPYPTSSYPTPGSPYTAPAPSYPTPYPTPELAATPAPYAAGGAYPAARALPAPPPGTSYAPVATVGELSPGGGWIADAGAFFLQPRWGKNPAYGTRSLRSTIRKNSRRICKPIFP